MKLTQTQLVALMTAIVATGRPFDPATTYVGLYVTMTDNGLGTVLADGAYPDATAFPRQAVTTWSAQSSLADGRRVVDAPAKRFAPPDGSTPATIRGWYLASALTAGTLLAWGTVGTPVSITDQNTSITVIPRLTLDPSGRWSAEVVYNG